MRLIELFSRSATKLGVKAENKADLIDQMVDLQFTHGNITDKDAYTEAIFAREEEYSTYVGNGIVVPHAKTNVVTAPSLAVAAMNRNANMDVTASTRAANLIIAPVFRWSWLS